MPLSAGSEWEPLASSRSLPPSPCSPRARLSLFLLLPFSLRGYEVTLGVGRLRCSCLATSPVWPRISCSSSFASPPNDSPSPLDSHAEMDHADSASTACSPARPIRPDRGSPQRSRRFAHFWTGWDSARLSNFLHSACADVDGNERALQARTGGDGRWRFRASWPDSRVEVAYPRKIARVEPFAIVCLGAALRFSFFVGTRAGGRLRRLAAEIATCPRLSRGPFDA